MTDPVAAKIIDELICLLSPPIRLENLDYSITDAAFQYLADYRNEHPGYPITLSIANELRRRKLIE